MTLSFSMIAFILGICFTISSPAVALSQEAETTVLESNIKLASWLKTNQLNEEIPGETTRNGETRDQMAGPGEPANAIKTGGYKIMSATAAAAGTTSRVSLNSNGKQGNGGSYIPAISADGHNITFESNATNLVPNDTNGSTDIFVHDQASGQTSRVSLASDGEQGNSYSWDAAISADGRYIVFVSYASNLVPGDTNDAYDIFVHDRQSNQTSRVSESSEGTQGNGSSYSPAISADGRLITFRSAASNLVAGDTNNAHDIFVHDLESGQTIRVSLASNGKQGNHYSYSPAISADGRYITFFSRASNLVPSDTNDEYDIFVHDLESSETSRVSVSSNGIQGNDWSWHPAISADGRFITYESKAGNLVSGDTNGEPDIFVHDRESDQTIRVSLASDGTQGNRRSKYPAISADGRYVAFSSWSGNLVPDDTNGADDVFVHDLQSSQTSRVTVSSDGSQGNRYSGYPAISSDGRYVAFDSGAKNLVPDDNNGVWDVFLHDQGIRGVMSYLPLVIKLGIPNRYLDIQGH